MNIVLIGMPGAGKSTLGVLLAKALGMDFVDTDIIIQQHSGRLLQEIIEKDGVEKFIEIEGAAIADLEADNCIIATGGSAVYSESAMKALKEKGRIVYLHVPYAEIEKRLGNITTRGIAIKKGRSLRDIYGERVPLYMKYSDLTIDCADKDIELCVGEIAGKIRDIMPGKAC